MVRRMKICCRCKQKKPIKEFYKNKKEFDGYRYGCKNCVGEYQKEYQKSLIGKEAFAKANKKYSKSSKGKRVQAKADKKYKEKYPQRQIAKNILNHAIRGGKTERRSCENCNSKDLVHGHHEDYSKPLEVIWFCSSCHREYHNQLRRVG